MRIWQYTTLNVSGVGGVETHISAASQELENLGHHVHIGVDEPEGWLSETSTPLFVQTHGDTWPTPKLLWALKKNQSARWIQVCHGTSIGRLLACREYTSLSGWRGTLRDFLPTLLADAAVAVTDQALFEARRYFRMRIPATVIANGANTQVFTPLSSVHTEPRVIFLGRSDDRVKNLDNILDACALIHRDHPDFEFRAAPGVERNGALFPFLRNLGALFGKDLRHALTQCRALILCSYYEGDPIVLHEARAMGLPVIVSDLPQIKEGMRHYENAFFADPLKSESIASAIRCALFERKELTPKPVIREWKTVAREFEAFYKRLISTKK